MATDLGKISQTTEGAYDNTKIYERLDTVSYQGSSYLSRINNNSQPLSNESAWQVSALKGEQGIQGIQGETGYKTIGGEPINPTDSAPTIVQFYKPTLSSEVGIPYPNLIPAEDTEGNSVILTAKDGYDTLFYFDGLVWTKSETLLPIIDINPIYKNINESLNGSLYIDFDFEAGKYLVPSAGVTVNSGDWNTSEKILVSSGLLYEILGLQGYLSLCFFDIDGNFVDIQQYSTNRNYHFKDLDGVSFFQFSWKSATQKPIIKVSGNSSENEINSFDNKIDFNQLMNGFFVNQNDGGIIIDQYYAVTLLIPIIALKKYTLNANAYQQYSFYDKEAYRIADGQSAGNIKNPITPATAVYFKATQYLTDISTNPNSMYLTNDAKPLLVDNNTIYVKKRGGDFDKIQDAIDYANTKLTKQTIIVDSGFWQENLVCTTGNGHTLKGASKNDTVIFSEGGGDVLKCKSGWTFQDLTFDQRYGGYAVHLDYGGAGLIEFTNCKFKTTFGNAIGAGSFAGQILRFRYCEIHQEGFWNADGGGLYWHNATSNGGAEQRLEMYWCDVYSRDSSTVLRIDDANQLYGDGGGNTASVLFIGTNFFSKAITPNSNLLVDLRGNSTPVGNLIGSIKLDPRSFGNNIPMLNFV